VRSKKLSGIYRGSSSINKTGTIFVSVMGMNSKLQSLKIHPAWLMLTGEVGGEAQRVQAEEKERKLQEQEEAESSEPLLSKGIRGQTGYVWNQ
jgi:hypothetical protein